jgi:flagellar motor switch protein FliG
LIVMTAPALTGLQKVAVLLKSMPRDVVDKVLRHLDVRHAGLVAAELAKLDEQKELGQKLSKVLDEAVTMLSNGAGPKSADTGQVHTQGPAAPAAPPAKTAAAKTVAKGQSVDMHVGGKPEPTAASAPPPAPPSKPRLDWPDASADPLAALAVLPSDLLATALESESTRTTSLLMNCLEVEVAGQIYKRLSPAKRKDVSLRFTEQAVVGEELIKRIALGVLTKCQALRESSTPATTEQGEREKRMAALLRGLERAERADMLTALEESDAELTGRVKALLYQFEDILRMENTSVQKVLSEIDVKSLALALRGAPREIEDKILANLSKRAQESLKEEISLTGVVPPAKVREARQTLVEAIQRLDQRGELVLIE